MPNRVARFARTSLTWSESLLLQDQELESMDRLVWSFAQEKQDAPDSELEQQVDQWLREPEIDLQFDPFRFRDASTDPKLSQYLIDHNAFEALQDDTPFFVFAEAGGGKTAFRVRLAYACRVGEEGHRIFPMVVAPPEPDMPLIEQLNRAAASELLLHLVYSPPLFLSLGQSDRQIIRQVLDWNLAESLDHLLNQIESLLPRVDQFHDWKPVFSLFDPAAGDLIMPPAITEVDALLRALRAIPPSPRAKRPMLDVRFESLLSLLHRLGYEAVYVLVDGVDAYLDFQQDPAKALSVLQPFLEQVDEWAKSRIYAKFFLPIELYGRLTTSDRFAIISWTPEALLEVLGKRIHAAAGEYRAVTTLDAISSRTLRHAEARLVREARPLPREVVMLAEQALIEHVRRVGMHGKLEPEDLDAAIAWYRKNLVPQDGFS